MTEIDRVPILVQQISKAVQELESLFPGRKFTMDGHLVGSLGEVIAAHRYGLKLLPPSSEGHDAVAPDGRRVQIKATQVDRVAMSSEPDVLLVLRLLADGSVEEIFNGPGAAAWQAAGKMQKNGQRPITAARLRSLMNSTAGAGRIPERL